MSLKGGRRRNAPAPVAPAAEAEASIIGDVDLHLFNEGRHRRMWERLGAHLGVSDGKEGAHFAVWAPDAQRVTVVGDFGDGWRDHGPALRPRGDSGIWEGFVPGARRGSLYKYRIDSRHGGYVVEKADPYAFRAEIPPGTASMIWDLEYAWGDGEWMAARRDRTALDAPISIYEVHLGSWMRAEDGRPLGYEEIADRLAPYVVAHGFTHVELLPVMEHPFYGSWGYQVTGYFAPTGRHGTPQELMALIDRMHREGIGVILDWVPAHFPRDEHGLGYFDGTHLYEHADPRKGIHPDWDTFVFNYARAEVRSFLLSSAMFWLDVYHADGLRVDGVASMLYLDYSRKEGEWIPNEHGGRENIEAVSFLREMNEAVYEAHPDVQTIAEESTAWPMVSRPTYIGGLGFGLKWDMGWMHDSLRAFSREPIHRRYHHHELTFRAIYAFHENFVLPLSHDEVVHGKGSLIGKMPGDEWQRFANLRLLYGYMFGLSGKKLLFMGAEIAQYGEWNHDAIVEWASLEGPYHQGVQRLVRDLNAVYRGEPALHQWDCDGRGFEWVEASDSEQSVLIFLRKGKADGDRVVVACNFTPVPRHNYRIGVDAGGPWREILNTDAREYGGSGQGNLGGVEANPIPWQGWRLSLNVVIPPLGVVYLKQDGTG